LLDLDYSDLSGKPFRLGARGPEYWDCWGLCCELGRRVGIEYPEVFTPQKVEDQDRIIKKTIDEHFERIERPEPFCIVTFKIHPPFVDHCGFVLPDRRHFVHIMVDHFVVALRLDHKTLAPKIEGYYRLWKE
jgi:hypothetical protein